MESLASSFRKLASECRQFVFAVSICFRQMGQGPSLASCPNTTITGPITTVFFSTVSFTVAVTVTALPSSLPVNRAGTLGPTATGKA